MSEALLSVRDLKVHFPVRIGGFLRGAYRPLKAVDGVSFDWLIGETLGIVGESGCGKSTLGRAVLQLLEPTAGQVVWLGKNIAGLDNRAMRPHRKDMQMVFQDPLASLNPRMTIGDIISEPLRPHKPKLSASEVKQAVRNMLDHVGLLPQMINRYPHEFSGGQCQRIGIARAMILQPKLIICDEPVSALDVSIQAQIVIYLCACSASLVLLYYFISHDLSVVRHISQRILVLYLGRVLEIADRDSLYRQPRHPYTKALISAVPLPDPKLERRKQRIPLQGDLPFPLNPPLGCVFRTRCPWTDDRCRREEPLLENAGPSHLLACHHWREQVDGDV